MSESKVEQTLAERGQVYGDPVLAHENIGLNWTGMIQQHYGIRLDHPIPAHLVALMMVQFKAQRAARVYHPDNFVDGAAYLNIAEKAQQGR